MYTLHKPARKRFPTRATLTAGPLHQFQADLNDLIPFKKDNRGFQYILTVFSREAFAYPLKDKSGESVAKAFQHLFKQGKKPMSIQTDQGKEFFNSKVTQLLKKHNVHLFAVKSQYKAALVERFNRTFKTRMFRYFTHIGKHRWFDVLDKFIDSYNNTPHLCA